MKNSQVLNAPNLLSIFRICLVPVFLAVYFSGVSGCRIYAASIYVLASITDVLDGAIARKFGLITNLGRVLDPLGDKLMTASVLVAITIDGIIPAWAAVLFIVKESVMGIGGLLIHRVACVEIPSSQKIGKATTAVFFVVCVVLMIFDNISDTVACIMISAAILLMIIAFITYSRTFLSIMKSSKEAEKS